MSTFLAFWRLLSWAYAVAISGGWLDGWMRFRGALVRPSGVWNKMLLYGAW